MNEVAKSCTRAKRFEQSVTSLTLQRDKNKQTKKKHTHTSLLSPPPPPTTLRIGHALLKLSATHTDFP
jgi:hypothetical protein